MHELALEQRRDLGVRAPWHVGDVTWGLRAHQGREHEWTIRIWKAGDRTVAWSWLKGDRGLLEYDVRRDRLDLLDEILAAPDIRSSVAFEDDEEVQEALLRNGFTADDDANLTRHGALLHFFARDLPGAPELPESERKAVMHVELSILAGHVLMGTDAPESMGQAIRIGNNITINLELDTVAEATRMYEALADGGSDSTGIQAMPWGHWVKRLPI